MNDRTPARTPSFNWMFYFLAGGVTGAVGDAVSALAGDGGAKLPG